MWKEVKESATTVQEKASEGIVGVAKIAGDLSTTVSKSVGPTVNRASEELPKVAQKVSNTVGGAVNGARSSIGPHWEWVKKQVEERRK